MPIHDWTCVSAGTFHDFHASWIIAIKAALNTGVLPSAYYAMAEQIAGPLGPDVLTLQASDAGGGEGQERSHGNGTVTLAPPKTRIVAQAQFDPYSLKQRSVAIRHSSDDRVVALIEVVSPGNKSNRHGIRSLVNKAVADLGRGIHLMLLDLLPPGRRDPQGVHGIVWAEISDEPHIAPPDKRLTLASYAAGETVTAYVEPVAVGDALPPMPLFLEAEFHVLVPLETTYQSAWATVPQRWRRVLEAK